MPKNDIQYVGNYKQQLEDFNNKINKKMSKEERLKILAQYKKERGL